MLALATLAALVAAPSYSQEAVARLIGGALSDGVAFARLADLTDSVGPRLSGSPGAEAAVKWAQQRFQEDGLSVHLEPVQVPHWVRGEERGEILAGQTWMGHPLALTALGGSVGTPAAGLTAEVIEARSIDEIAALGERARGRILFLNHTMGAPGSKVGYGDAVELRVRGPAAAGKVGAVAVLMRSLATSSLRSPHTGVTIYDEGFAKIPAAAISLEDADTLHRLLGRGQPLRVKLGLGCRTLPDADSFNVVAEVRGSELPEEIVLLGAHLDSWDLATGAIDDGAGAMIVMEAGRLLAQLKPAPRRTVRVVLFMNEENGTAGGKAYAKAHQAELARHVAAIEADSGAGRPLGITVRAAGGEGGAPSPAVGMLTAWLTPLVALGSAELSEGGEGGADLGPMGPSAVPFLGVRQDTSHYFDVHHSAADTLDKVEPQALAANAATLTWLAYALAEMKETVPRPTPLDERPRTTPRPAAR